MKRNGQWWESSNGMCYDDIVCHYSDFDFEMKSTENKRLNWIGRGSRWHS